MLSNNFINKITISGCKGIKDPLTINFSNSTFDPNQDFKGSNFKGIYGANSTNKSSIIVAMYIYKWAIVAGTHNVEIEEFIKQSVNKQEKEMTVAIIYSFPLADNTISVYRHTLTISNEAKVTFESIDVLQGQYIIEDKFKTLMKLENGKLKEVSGLEQDLKTRLIDLINSTNIDQSIIRSFDLIKRNISTFEIFTNQPLFAVAKIGKALFDIYVYINDGCKYCPVFSFKNKKVDSVSKEDLEKYKSLFSNINNFLIAFDKNLTNIELDIKLKDEKTYDVSKTFDFGSFKLTFDELSKSDKKLYSIFPLLYKCFQGSIVFIDDFNESISDLAFEKLLAYLIKRAKGQLVFTSNSEAGIDALKVNSHAIDFISHDKISSFKKTGNISPTNKYKKENDIDDNDLMVAFELFI